jgi:hypothetical protein
MGTRSLLAYEHSPEIYHVQYLQFDGYPSVKGWDYYNFMRRMDLCRNYFVKDGKPTKKFFKKCRDYLNYIQWSSGHSFEHHWKCSPDKWLSQDAGQEWQYLFDAKGNFHIWRGRDEICVIPFEATVAMSDYKYEETLEAVFAKMNDMKRGFKLRLCSGERLCFPEQGEGGWRNFSTLYQGKEPIAYDLFGGKHQHSGERDIRWTDIVVGLTSCKG